MVQMKPNARIKGWIAILLVAGAPGVAWAGFEMAPPPPPPPKEAPRHEVVTSGLGPVDITPAGQVEQPDVVRGFGSDVPLGFAAMQIVPSDKTVSFGAGVDANRKVSWQGGRPWRAVLGDLVAPAMLRDAGSMVIIEQGAGATETIVSLAVEAVAAPPPPPPPPPPPVWQARKGEMLQEVLRRWCAEERVEMRWAAEFDYPLGVDFRREGAFKLAVRDILRGFENARPKPVGRLHMNAEIGHPVLLIESRGSDFYGE